MENKNDCLECGCDLSHCDCGKWKESDDVIPNIIIEGGSIFEGTLNQFKDCFFSNATIKSICDWCVDSDYSLEIKYEKTCNRNGANQ